MLNFKIKVEYTVVFLSFRQSDSTVALCKRDQGFKFERQRQNIYLLYFLIFFRLTNKPI